MTKNITFTAEDELTEAARELARSDDTTLNEQFRQWLERYVHERRMEQYGTIMADLRGKVVVGRTLNRDEMNER